MKNNKESLYLQERAYLRELAQRVAKASPHLTDFLVTAHDPDIQRLFEAFALLIARLRDKLEDNFPEITHGILSRIWPLVLCPIPPTTIVQFFPTDGEHQGAADIPKALPFLRRWTGSYSVSKPAALCILNLWLCGIAR